MAKGNVILKISGILLFILSIIGILWSMYYGFTGAMGFSKMEKAVITGLLIFFGLFGILTGFFQLAVASTAFRHSKNPERGVRCIIVWGVIILILGVFQFVLLKVTSGMIYSTSVYYPRWYGTALIIICGIVLPVLIILGGVSNRVSFRSVRIPEGKNNSKPEENEVDAKSAETENSSLEESPETEHSSSRKNGGR